MTRREYGTHSPSLRRSRTNGDARIGPAVARDLVMAQHGHGIASRDDEWSGRARLARLLKAGTMAAVW